MGFTISLFIWSLVFQMFQVSTASTHDDFFNLHESGLPEDSWKRARESYENYALGHGYSTDHHVWGQIEASPPPSNSNWSITVTDTGLGAQVQVVYMGIPAILDAEISATMNGPGANKTENLVSVGGGGYAAYLSAGMPGEYKLSLLQGTLALGDPSYTVHVANAPSPFTSVVTPCNATTDTGTQCTITIEARDASKTVRKSPGNLCPFNILIMDQKGQFYQPDSVVGPVGGDGKCAIGFIPLRSRVYTAQVSIGGTILTNNGVFNITVKPASTAKNKFVVESPNKLSDGTYPVGTILFNIRRNDPFYMAIHGFTINVKSSEMTLLLECNDMRSSPDCSFAFNVTKTFGVTIDVLLDNTTAITTGMIANFSAGLINGENSQIKMSGNQSKVTSGDLPSSFEVSLMDDYSNPAANYSSGDLQSKLVVDLITPKTPSCYQYYVATIAKGSSPGVYNATFSNLTCAANYTVRGWYGFSSNVIEGSGIPLVVVAGKENSRYSSVLAGNDTKFSAGGTIGVSAFVADVSGNPVPEAVVSFQLSSNLLNNSYTAVYNGDHWDAVIGEGITVAGYYDLSVMVGGVKVAMSNVTCTAGRLDATRSNFTLGNFTAGVQNNFSLSLLDQYGNPIEMRMGALLNTSAGAVHLNGSGTGAAWITMVPGGNGSKPNVYSFTMEADVAGPYQIKIPYSRPDLGSTSNYIETEVTVRPAPIDASMSGLTGPALGGGVAGTNFTVYIEPRDAFGNLLEPNDADIALLLVNVTVTNSNGSSTILAATALDSDLDNGRYMTQVNATVSGTCRFQLTQKNTKTVGFAYFTIRPGPISGALTTLSGMGLNGSVVNQPATFFIKAKDSFGNVMDDLGSAPVEFMAKLCKVGAICVTKNNSCTDDCDSAGRIAIRDRHLYGGMYAVTWNAPTVGNYSISLTSGTENITGSAMPHFHVINLAERGDPTAKGAMVCEGLIDKKWCPGYFGSTAGVKARFTVALADSTGKFVSSSGTELSITLTPADATAVTEIIDSNNGFYTIVYVITNSRNSSTTPIELAVNLVSTSELITTAKLTITPAWTSAEKSNVESTFTTHLKAGDMLSTTITPKDAYGNKQVYGLTYPATNDKFIFLGIRETGERVHGTVTWNDTSSVWNAYMRLTWSGIYYVAIQLDDVPLGTSGATATITVDPANATIANSILLQPWLPPIRSMETSYFEVPALSDKFGNQILNSISFLAKATGANASAVVTLECFVTNTTFALATCDYTFNKSGIYTINYGPNGLNASTSIEVLPGPAADTSTVQGPGLTNCTVGQPSILTINCFDLQGNNCSGQPATAFKAVLTPTTEGTAFAALGNTSSTPVIADIWSTPDSKTYVSYIVPEVGNWTVNVTLQDGVNISGSPFTVSCGHAFSSPEKSFAYVVDPPRKLDSDGIVAMVAGTVVELGVLILDDNGNRQHPSVTGDAVNVTFTPENRTLPNTGVYLSDVTKNADATFSFSVSASKVGTWDGGVMTPINYILNVNCSPADHPTSHGGVAGAPFTFVVLPDKLSVASTFVTLLASNGDEKGLTSVFRIVTQDAYGNIAAYNQTLNVTAIIGKWEPSTDETGAAVPPTAAPPPPKLRRLLQTSPTQVTFPEEGGGYTITPLVANNFDGSYTFTFSVTKAGPYNISVFIDSEQVGTGTWTIQDFMVGAGSPDFARLLPVSDTLGKEASGLNSTQTGNITIAMADIFGNPVMLDPDAARNFSAYMVARKQLRKLQVNSYQVLEDADCNITLANWTVGVNGTISAPYSSSLSGIFAIYMWFTDSLTGRRYLSAMTPVTGPILSGPVNKTSLRAFGGGTVAALISPCDDNGYCVVLNNTVEIELFDAHKNVLNPDDLTEACASITTENNYTAIVNMASEAVVSKSAKTCIVSYSVADTNETYIQVAFNISFQDELIRGSPWVVPLRKRPSEINIQKSFLWGDLGGVIEAGKVGVVTAQLVDKDGVWLAYSPMEGNEYVQLITYNQTEGVLAPTLSTQDNGDGTFTLTYATASCGSFGYQPVIGYNMRAFGPVFVVRVVASETVVAMTSVSLISTNYTIYRAGYDPVLIEVQPTDQFSNLQDYYFASPDMFQARIERPDGSVAYQTLDRQVKSSSYGVPYHKWLLTYYPEQAPVKSSTMYIFYIMWSNGTAEELVPSAPIKIYTMPGPPAANFVQILGQGGSRATVGRKSSFVVVLYDKYNNQVVKMDDVILYNITMVLQSLGDDELINEQCDTYPAPPGGLCSFTIYSQGTYIIDIWANSERLLQQSVVVNEPSICANTSRASGDGVGTTDNPVVAGFQTEFMIQAFDMLNNSLSANALSNVTTTFEVSGYNLLSTGVIRPADKYPLRLAGTNRVLVRYTVLKSGRYAVNVKRAGVHISGSPYYVTVNPGKISSMSTVDDASMSSCRSGQSHRVTVTARDNHGNIRTYMEDTLTIMKSVLYQNESIMDTMTPLGDGVYSWNFTCITAGTPNNPNTTSIKVFSGSAQVWSGMISVLPGRPDPSQFLVGAFDLVHVGEVGVTTVFTADSAGNPLWTGDLPITVFLMHPEYNTSASGEDWYNGTYTFTWMITKSGLYTVVAEFNSTAFYQGPLWIFPGSPDPKSTSVMFDVKSGYTAGVEGTLWIQFFDAYQNNITADVLVPTDLHFTSLSVDPEARRATFLAKDVTFSGSSIYTVTFIPLYAGLLTMDLKVNGMQVLQNGQPYTTQVIAGPPSVPKLYAWGGGWTAGGVVGSDAVFFLRMRDAMDNLIETEPPALLTVTFSGAVAPEAVQTYMGSGMMMITYVPSAAVPQYSISVAYDSVPALTSGILSCNTTVGNFSAARSVVMGSDGAEVDNQGVIYALAGDTILFGILPRDESGFPYPGPPPEAENVNTPVYIVKIPTTPTQVIEADTATFTASFELTSTEAKDYTVIVQSHGGTQEVSNSGFTVKFLPGTTSAPNCIVTTTEGLPFDPTKPLVAGETLGLIAYAKDVYDNVQIYNVQNADVFVATLTAGTVSQVVGVTMGYTSVYNLTLQIPVVAGAGTLVVNVNGAQVVSYAILVAASTLYLEGTEITPWYLDPMVAGVEAYFDIVPIDAYQNVINAVNATQQIFAALAVKVPGDVINNVTQEMGPPKYIFSEQAALEPGLLSQGLHATVMPKRVGNYSVVVASSAGRVSGDNTAVVELATVEILPGAVDITRSFAAVIDSAYLAGTTITFRITGLDSYNNIVPTLPSVSSDPYYNIMVTPAVCSGDDCSPSYTADAMFTPHSYGDVNVTITWDGIDAIEHKMEITPRGAPTMLTALMEDTGGTITVTFAGISDAGLRSLRGMRNGPERCQMLLDNTTYSKLGTGPDCGFKNATAMYVQLGYGATIMPAGSPSPDYITLSAEGVFAEHQTSLPTSGSVLIRPPNNLPALVAILAAPTIVGACDDFVLDASASYGAQGRPLMFEYHVKGTGDLLKLAALGYILESLPNDTMSLTIPAGSLEANRMYTFVVVVMNYLGKRAMASVDVEASVTPVPILHIPGSAQVQTFSRGQIVSLEAVVEIPGTSVYDLEAGSCYATKTRVNTSATQMLFQWNQLSGPFADVFYLGDTGQKLNIPGNQLMTGYTYEFAVSVKMAGYPSQFSLATASVAVVSSPLQVFIKGGDRAINASQDLILEAVAYDPDDLVDEFGNSFPFNYVWTWSPNVTIHESLLYVYTDHDFGSVIKIPANTLNVSNSTVYNFTVTVTKEGAQDSAQDQATIKPSQTAVNMACEIENSANLYLGVYSSSQVVIACTAGFESYNWSMSSLGDQRLLWELDPMVVIEGSIKIPPYGLLDARSYTITCEGRNSDGRMGSASVTFDTVLNPSGGTATLTQSQKKNAGGKTLYSLLAHGWMAGSGGGQLLYEFRYWYKKGKTLKEYIIQPLSASNSVSDFLMLGGDVTIDVYVCDSGTPRIHSNDAPPGAKYSLPLLKISGKGRRRRSLLGVSFQDSYWQIVNEGKYFNALTAMEILGTESIGQSSRCVGSHTDTVNKMVDTILLTAPTEPPACSTGGQTEGPGPAIALKTACVFAKILGKPGNARNFSQVVGTFELFLRDLRLISEFGLNVGSVNGQPYDPCFYDAANTFMNAVKARCYTFPGKGSPEQQHMIERVSVLPNLIARTIVNDPGFKGPLTIKRHRYTAAAMRLPMSFDVYDGPNIASGTILNLQFDITSVKPGGVPIGVAMSCSSDSPLATETLNMIKNQLPFKSLISVCDVSFTGHTDGDWGLTTIRGSWQKLHKLNKKNSYVPLMVEGGIPSIGELNNVLSTSETAEFDFVRALSRVVLIEVKGTNFSINLPPPPTTVTSPPANATTMKMNKFGKLHSRAPSVKMARRPGHKLNNLKTQISTLRSWRYGDRPQMQSTKKQNTKHGTANVSRFWSRLVGR